MLQLTAVRHSIRNRKRGKVIPVFPYPPFVISPSFRVRRAKQQQVSRKYAATGQQHLEQEEQRGEGGYHGEDILFDSSSSVGAGRWPCERHPAKPSGVNPGRGRSTSPLGSVSPDSRGHSSKSTRGAGGSTIVLSPASVGRGASMRSGSARGGGKTSTNSPTRCEGLSGSRQMLAVRIVLGRNYPCVGRFIRTGEYVDERKWRGTACRWRPCHTHS